MSYNVFGVFVIYFSIFICGLIAYASFAGCDPMLLGILKRKEEILPYFVMNKMGSIPGLPGIYVSAIISGLLSTLSSLTNSNAAQIWRDFCLKFEHFQTASSSYATLVNKIICKWNKFLH
ncbi:Sodium-coupled monocarboxylate transporter 2 [Armadillidium nasatum]|uniref:Sodium-coupled monocarboxylate transporter 2 n=1 Tax=Armadillidium nasatum TaxID=96803 RepID=A0A5N5TEY9_9CRUS|nr:Sodium-coupled monocarboxylate transporter 2 [Armadillidium nasatum]